MIMVIAGRIFLVSIILCFIKCNALSSHNNNSSGVDRRKAIQQVATFGSAAAGSCSFPTTSFADTATSTTLLTGGGGIIEPVSKLSDGTSFPLASFGLQIYNDDMAYKLTLTALEVGYRNFFASVLAGNQRGFARAVKDSGIPREDLFICGSVVSNRVSGFDNARKETTKGWERNMEAFSAGDIDYLDQIMLDYPGPDCASIQGQWSAFEEMYEQGLSKTLAVSNFSPLQLDCVLVNNNKDTSKVIKPVVNQLPYSVAYHPNFSDTIRENSKRGVLVQAWAPLGGSLGGRFTSSMKNICAQIGKKYQKSFAQVALRWIVQTGASFTTQSKNKQHFAEDLDIFDFELTPEEMAIITNLAS